MRFCVYNYKDNSNQIVKDDKGVNIMKRSRIVTTVITLVIGVITLSGCANNENTELDRIDVNDLITASKPVIPPIVFNDSNDTEKSNSSRLDNVDTSLGNNSLTDSETSSSSINNESSSILDSFDTSPDNSSSTAAEIEISTSRDYYCATAAIYEYDTEKVKNIFFGNSDVADNTQYYSDRDPIYMWKKEDKELCISNGDAALEYTSDLSKLINIIFSVPTQNTRNNNFKHIGDELDFCTRAEAVNSVSNILAELGIYVSEKADIYALCQSDMQSVIDEECAKGEFYQFDDEWNRIPINSYTVQKNQECYYISFNAEWNKIPIYNNTLYYMSIKDLAIFHPTITAIYSAEGLVGLNVSEYRSVIHQGEKITSLISPEAAAQVVGEKYKDVVGIEKISFDKMSLMYVLEPITKNGKINLQETTMAPAWVCTVEMTEYKYDRKTGTQAAVTSQKDILIDAQTGLEII